MSDPADPTTQPSPDGGWSEDILTIPGAVVVPPETGAFVQPAGVLHGDGRYCPQGALWRKWRPLTTAPEAPGGPVADLPGRWLWGGVLWQHFGHFLAESTTRLWPLPVLEGIDGVLFIPKRPDVGDKVAGYQRDFVDQLAPGLPIRVATEPLRVDTLVVPGQGFGLGPIIRGTGAFRAAIHARFGADIAAEGPEKLYVSRSALGIRKGGLVGETRLEAYLAAEGYEVFHPQRHSMAEQIARYKAARQVIGAEGSALHLFAMVARPDQQVAVVLRRRSSASNFIEQHIESFAGRAPRAAECLRRTWMPEGESAKRLGLGELDFPALERDLAAGGFVGGTAGWQDMTDDEVATLLGRRGRRMQARPAPRREADQAGA
ncbi:DUF563 domain-containing protein [Pseudooceanicola sp. LIPI14-2-Ac024]|uniref:glycosyltransferase family 61 protein n=1 Tax=Pseudooceanicola sp. LIPI14-2-Ac024 TaxID=3344875 RepID=UPI0035CF4099